MTTGVIRQDATVKIVAQGGVIQQSQSMLCDTAVASHRGQIFIHKFI